MLLIVRTEKEGNKSKRDLILNLFYSGFYLPLACWVSQSRGSDCLCRTKNFISMLLLMLTHFIILEHLSIKFIETLKSLNSTQSSKGIREPIIFLPNTVLFAWHTSRMIRLWFYRSVERDGIVTILSCVMWKFHTHYELKDEHRTWLPSILFCELCSRQRRLWF